MFLQASLDVLVKNLFKMRQQQGCDMKEAFPHLARYFNNKWKPKQISEKAFSLLLKKGFFPYEWFNSFELFDQTCLPPREAFYSSLTEQDISDEDYQHAQKVWEIFKISNFKEYHDLYLGKK